MIEDRPLIYKYLRHDKKFPHVWCPGCGIGIMLGALIRAIDRTGYEKDEIVMVSGIGCTGRLPVYVDFNTLHTTHGRALTFATGVKLANPALKVTDVVVTQSSDEAFHCIAISTSWPGPLPEKSTMLLWIGLLVRLMCLTKSTSPPVYR